MQSRSRTILRSCCLTLIGLVSCGCHQVEKQPCTSELPSITVAPVPPDVVVIGHESPRQHRVALQTLTIEIRNSLALLGGLHLLDSPTVMLDPPCEGPTQQPTLVGQLQPVGFTEFESAPLISPALYPSDFGGDYPSDKYEVRVTIHEFLEYRPMRLAGTITVQDTTTGTIICTIQNTWYAPKDCNPIADASCSLQQSLKRPQPAGHLEGDAMAVLSPQRFLYQIAKKVAPEIRAACLPGRCLVDHDEPR